MKPNLLTVASALTTNNMPALDKALAPKKPDPVLVELDCDASPGPSYTLRIYGVEQATEYEDDGPGGRVVSEPAGWEVLRVTANFGEGECDIDITDEDTRNLLREYA